MIIAIDFDGTCVTNEFPNIGTELPYCSTVLKLLVNNGHTLVLNTVRSNKEEVTVSQDDSLRGIISTNGSYLDDAINWFKERDIPIVLLDDMLVKQKSWTDSNKLYADIYIDDRNLSYYACTKKSGLFIDWINILYDLLSIGVIKIDNLEDFAWLSYITASSKGFHEKERDSLSVHALISSEVGEATEEVRHGNKDLYYEPDGKPCGEASEIADVIIRCLDYSIERNWNIRDIILSKLSYNSKRPYKHNKQV